MGIMNDSNLGGGTGILVPSGEQGSQWKPFTAVHCERIFCFFIEFMMAEYNAKQYNQTKNTTYKEEDV